MTPVPAGPEVLECTLDDLVDRARALVVGGERRLLGITGAPGAGKSTVAAHVAAQLGPQVAALVAMDGFHLANSVLERLGRRDRKGAPDTFDAGGYVDLLRRLRAASGPGGVFAPEYRREVGESSGSAGEVVPAVRLVRTEGNYLRLDTGAWAGVRGLLDEVWFLEVDDAVRLERLVRRHERFGKSPVAAASWARGSDQRNAEVIATTRARADLILRLV